MAHRTFQERGYCTRAGYRRLDEVLGQLCYLGNAALQERRDAWAMARTSISYIDQCRSLTLVRSDEPNGLGELTVSVARSALKRVDRAFAAFFRRCKEGGKPGFPRFRNRRRYTTIEITDVQANQVRTYDAKTLVRVKGLPTITLRPHRELPETKPRCIRIVRRACGCTVNLVYEHQPEPLELTGENVGVDVGVRKRVALSNGETVTPEQQGAHSRFPGHALTPTGVMAIRCKQFHLPDL